jgi:hypothetical protein
VSDLVPISKQTLTPGEFSDLADVSPELERLVIVPAVQEKRNPDQGGTSTIVGVCGRSALIHPSQWPTVIQIGAPSLLMDNV